MGILEILAYVVRGFDVSQYQDNPDTKALPDLKKAKVFLLATFIGVRIGYGVVEDRLFRFFWTVARLLLDRIPYFYLDYYSHLGTGKSNKQWGIEQARFAWSLLKPDPGEVALFLDVEKSNLGGEISRLYPSRVARVREIARAFRDEYERLSGKKIGVYTTPGLLWLFEDDWKDRPIWLAWYNINQTIQSLKVELAKVHWRGPLIFWQYRSDGDANNDGVPDGIKAGMETANLDLNIYPGTMEEWSRFVGEHTPESTQPPATEDETPKPQAPLTYRRAVVVGDSGVNVRLLPGTDNNCAIVDWIPKGAVIEIIEETRDNLGNPWGRVRYKQFCNISYRGNPMLQILE
ncbi:MAG: GH25 family lysozyme [Anaerolineaceae bacterium]